MTRSIIPRGPRTFLDKVWDQHVIASLGSGVDLLHVDRNFLHEMSGAISLRALKDRGLPVRNPDLTFATVDHVVETHRGRSMTTRTPGGNDCLTQYSDLIAQTDVTFFGLNDSGQGIVHVIAPDLGIALPGMTFVCGDSHTCTVGGIGVLAFGVGTSDSEHVLATQTMMMGKPLSMNVRFDRKLRSGVYAKDMIMALIGSHGADGGKGYALEFTGEAVSNLSVPGRLTLCNMAVEFGARTGFVAPDETTYNYLKGRPFAPRGPLWDIAVAYWKTLTTDIDAEYDAQILFDCSELAPQITWGTSPEQVIAIDGCLPRSQGQVSTQNEALRHALEYMGLSEGQPLAGVPIDGVFIGSCTNGRLDDLRTAAIVMKGRKVAPNILALCSPGSSQVKALAEAEGLDRVFIDAGFQWREAGCSLCISGGMGGESFGDGTRIVTSTNRNFKHRQGRNVKSHLASPMTVAASAIAGAIADPRTMVQ